MARKAEEAEAKQIAEGGAIRKNEIDEDDAEAVAKRKKEEEKEKKKEKKKLKKAFTFPWYFKVIAYLLSASFAGVSLFFIVVKGIVLGDEAVGQWLSSIATSFISSVVLTQPVQVTIKHISSFVSGCFDSQIKNIISRPSLSRSF
jgi:hypothetical protein